ncbi:family 43 glycosylhydrolase [Streptomyces sp. JV176]|uniref:glycoside hydrolase family 43 protein n=1 Tax=Streptomyces sp. JV176 TaxID=858630 RepID=UPI002E78433E|nr:family 43 glycosylhydrolase [Streptomyces sp. JV176]MEE1800688.1 family 43 glycosylhydrolase [Streptomyces sp. JV176]
MSHTPILSGFHPDPSICRVGEDFYLVTSSFEYLPGVPVFHSRDLLRWEQIGNVLDREDQLVLPSGQGSGGIFAPTLRHHGGRFWMITTNMADVRGGHLIVSAEDPAGPWSTPVRTTGAVGIDPDLAWDLDDTCHLTWASGRPGSPIRQVTIDPSTGVLLSEPRALWSGTGMAHPEAPHLYRRGSWWYLLIAEGGTERGHSVSVARSRSIAGPFEGDPANPVLTHRSSGHPVQNTGHADLVELPSGEWAAVHLGVRPRGTSPGFHVNGRETFLAAVRWEDGWPVFDEEHHKVPESGSGFLDDFTAPALHPRWISPGIHPRRFATPSQGGGVALTAAPRETGARHLLGVRAKDAEWEASAVVGGGDVRLVLRLDDTHWAAVEKRGASLVARVVIGGLDHVLADVPRPGHSAVTLCVRAVEPKPGSPYAAGPDLIELGHLDDGGFRRLAQVDGRYFSTEVAGGFTGRVIGIEPLAGTRVVRSFRYRPGRDSGEGAPGGNGPT